MKKNSVPMAIKAVSQKLMEDPWMADSGATCHITNKLKGLYNIETIKEPIMIGDGSKVYATMCGDLDVQVKTLEGKVEEFTLKNVKYIPRFYMKLFSLTSTMWNGAKIMSKGMSISLIKGESSIVVFWELI